MVLLLLRATAAIVSVLGLIVTAFLPETKGKSLEEPSEEPSTPMENALAQGFAYRSNIDLHVSG